MSLSRSQMEALLRRLRGPVRRAFERAIRNAKGRASVQAMVVAIESGDVDALLRAIGLRDGMYSTLTEQIRAVYGESGSLILASDLPRNFDMDFDINNPRAESWLRMNSSSLITGNLMPEQRAAIQEILQSGMSKGQNPTSTALDIVGRISKQTGRRQGGVIGLNQQQAKFAVNMAADLENLDCRYFSRKLRDRRFDNAVRKAIESGKPLSRKVQNKIVARYEGRLLKHRGDTIARTETLQSLNAANDEALQQVVQEGLAPRNAVVRVWRHSFSANERPGHLMMEGQRRGLDELFVNPITFASLLYPGSGPASEVINCRCFVEHEIDFFAVEVAA